MLVADDILGIIEPVELSVAAGQPGTSLSVDGGLRLIEPADIAEGGGSLVESAALKLRLAHHQPCLPEEGVVFAARQPLNVLLRLLARLVPFWPCLDAVLFDGLFHLLHRAVEVAFAYLTAALIADSEKRQQFGIVVLVAFFLLQLSVDEGLLAVIESIVFGPKRLPKACPRSILMHGTTCRQQQDGQQNDDD